MWNLPGVLKATYCRVGLKILFAWEKMDVPAVAIKRALLIGAFPMKCRNETAVKVGSEG